MNGIGPEQISNVYNLVISTESATILANSFKKFWLVEWGPVITSVISLIIATIAIFISRNSTKITHNSFVSSIQKLYFEIMSSLPLDDNKKVTENHILLIINYFEFICDLYYKNILKNRDISFVSEKMKNESFVKNLNRIFKTNKHPNTFKNYTKWLKENGIDFK